MRRALISSGVVAVSLFVACGVSDDAERRGSNAGALAEDAPPPTHIPSTGPVPSGCVRIEGGDIGAEDLVVQLDGASVTITAWRAKDGEGDEVGFTFSSTAPIGYAVKAGGSTFHGTATSWVHPNGTSGPAASGISNITFCPRIPGGGTGGGSGAGGGLGEVVGGGAGGGNGGSGGGLGEVTGGGAGGGGAGGGSGGLVETGGHGTPCTSPSQCVSSVCSNGSCVGGAGPRGTACLVVTECYSLVCTAGVCAGGGSGDRCRTLADCQAGLACGPDDLCIAVDIN